MSLSMRLAIKDTIFNIYNPGWGRLYGDSTLNQDARYNMICKITQNPQPAWGTDSGAQSKITSVRSPCEELSTIATDHMSEGNNKYS